MRRVLILTGRYLPGWRDGGPVRSVLNLCEWLGDEYDIRIMCLDRDHFDTKSYPGIKTNEYNTVGKARVWYVESFTPGDIARLSGEADVVYVCGPYNDYARIAMKLKKDGVITAPLYVASMGSFSPEAFKIKGFKKRLFITYMKLSHMFDDITWSVTSAREEEELKAVVGKNAKCVIAKDLPRRGFTKHSCVKEQGVLKLAFVSRICRKKNLSAIPGILHGIDDDITVRLDIYGADEDRDYLHACMEALDELRKTHPLCRWKYHGEAESEEIPRIFAGHDAFLFPTLGENYGHVIAESLSAGCIPVISDTTPWTDLNEKGCGYVCPLSDDSSFASAVEELAAMDETTLDNMRKKCYEYTDALNQESQKHSGYRDIFG